MGQTEVSSARVRQERQVSTSHEAALGKLRSKWSELMRNGIPQDKRTYAQAPNMAPLDRWRNLVYRKLRGSTLNTYSEVLKGVKRNNFWEE